MIESAATAVIHWIIEGMNEMTDVATSAGTILMGLNWEWLKAGRLLCRVSNQLPYSDHLVPNRVT